MFDSFFCSPKTAEFSHSHLPDAEGLRVFSGARRSLTTGVAFSAPAAAVVSFLLSPTKHQAVFKKIHLVDRFLFTKNHIKLSPLRSEWPTPGSRPPRWSLRPRPSRQAEVLGAALADLPLQLQPSSVLAVAFALADHRLRVGSADVRQCPGRRQLFARRAAWPSNAALSRQDDNDDDLGGSAETPP